MARAPASGVPTTATDVVAMPAAPAVIDQESYGPAFTYKPGTIVTNAPFDDRLFPALPHCGAVSRGLISEYSPEGPYRLRFMYNPNEIAYAFQLSGSLIPMDQTAAVPTAGAIGGHGITFECVFDRHYEVAYDDDLSGVFRDITVLKGLVGITDESKQGFMTQKVLKFIFGEYFCFYGYIDTMTINIAYFSRRMVPMRAGVMINATFVPPVADGKWHVDTEEGNKTAADAAAAPPPPPPKAPDPPIEWGNPM